MLRGEIWWANLADPVASEPGYRRPVLIVQSNDFNRSRINTVVALALTSNLKLSEAPGNVRLPAKKSGLPKDSVVNVSQIITLDKQVLSDPCGKLGADFMGAVDDGLRLVLAL
jgi:mRNA interferase MazF